MSNECRIKIEWNGHKTSLLSWTSDMNAWSFSLPAGQPGACPGMVADTPDHICYGCYAQINRYNMPNVLRAQWVRFNWIRENLKTEDGRKNIVDTLVGAINRHCTNGFFRGHDSGDFFNAEYAKVWYEVIRQCQHVHFWFPTRSYNVPSVNKILANDFGYLPNVSIRPSALKFNELPPDLKVRYKNKVYGGRGYSAGTTVQLEGYKLPDHIKLCPKTVNGGSCESNKCRTCWTGKSTQVAYLIHGRRGSSKVANATTETNQRGRLAMAKQFISLTVKGM